MPRPVALTIFAFIFLRVFAVAYAPITAQDATPAARPDHPVVGAWWTANDAPGPGVNTAAAIFHADGTYLEVDPNIGVGVGAWRASGERTADLVAVYQDIDSDPAATMAGTVTVRQSVTLDETGDGFTAPFTIEVRIPDG